MKKIILSLFFINMSTLLFVDKAMPKCPYETIKVIGSVITKDRDCIDCSISDASVIVFLDKDKYGDSEISRKDGTFEVNYKFNTYKGPSLWGDRCGKLPSKITIIISLDEYYPCKIEYKIKKLDNNFDDSDVEIKFIKIPAISLEQKGNE